MTIYDSLIFGQAGNGGGGTGGDGVIKYAPGVTVTEGDVVRSMIDYLRYVYWRKVPVNYVMTKDPEQDPDHFLCLDLNVDVGGTMQATTLNSFKRVNGSRILSYKGALWVNTLVNPRNVDLIPQRLDYIPHHQIDTRLTSIDFTRVLDASHIKVADFTDLGSGINNSDIHDMDECPVTEDMYFSAYKGKIHVFRIDGTTNIVTRVTENLITDVLPLTGIASTGRTFIRNAGVGKWFIYAGNMKKAYYTENDFQTYVSVDIPTGVLYSSDVVLDRNSNFWVSFGIPSNVSSGIVIPNFLLKFTYDSDSNTLNYVAFPYTTGTAIAVTIPRMCYDEEDTLFIKIGSIILTVDINTGVYTTVTAGGSTGSGSIENGRLCYYDKRREQAFFLNALNSALNHTFTAANKTHFYDFTNTHNSYNPAGGYVWYEGKLYVAANGNILTGPPPEITPQVQLTFLKDYNTNVNAAYIVSGKGRQLKNILVGRSTALPTNICKMKITKLIHTTVQSGETVGWTEGNIFPYTMTRVF